MGMHQLDMMLLDEVDEVKHVPEAAQYAALVESQLEYPAQRGLGQSVRYVENLVATPGQFVTDRGGIDLSSRHFELGECHQYIHGRVSERRVASSHPSEGDQARFNQAM